MEGNLGPHVSFPIPAHAVPLASQNDFDEELLAQFFDLEKLRRLQACVTACEGISTAELEDGLIQRMRQALIQVVPLLEEAEQLKARHGSCATAATKMAAN
jgi:glutamate racemase